MATAKQKKRALTKAELIQALVRETGPDISRRQVVEVLDALRTIGYRQLRRSGLFTIPGFAKLEVKRRKGTRAGVRSVFGEPRFMPARPAVRRVSARALKVCHDAVG
ncbi:MAG: HU family DNA-binding protein [Myxococcota bacterium]